MVTDFVIMLENEEKTPLLWMGYGNWTNDLKLAKVYNSWEQVSKAIKRGTKNLIGAKYLTKEEYTTIYIDNEPWRVM